MKGFNPVHDAMLGFVLMLVTAGLGWLVLVVSGAWDSYGMIAR